MPDPAPNPGDPAPSPAPIAPPSPATPASPTPPGSPPPAPSPSPDPSRPAWLDQRFKAPEELAKSYTELEKKLQTRREEIRAEVNRELLEERTRNAPKAPGDYAMPEIKGADGATLVVNPDDPIFGFFRNEAHRMGLTQQQFEEAVGRYVDVELSRGPDWNVEKAQLGENADMRKSRVATWAKQNLDDESFAFFAELPGSAKMIKMFEKIMEQSGAPTFAPAADGISYQTDLSKAELLEMQKDPRYWRNGGEPQFVAKVRAGFQKLAGSRR